MDHDKRHLPNSANNTCHGHATHRPRHVHHRVVHQCRSLFSWADRANHSDAQPRHLRRHLYAVDDDFHDVPERCWPGDLHPIFGYTNIRVCARRDRVHSTVPHFLVFIPTATPTWSAWETVSATCRGSSTCQPQRETGPVPCASGQYGAWSGQRERFRRCTNATTQAPGWDAWSVVTPNYGCTSCPPNITDTTTQWVTQSTPCPVGQVGSYTWEEEQVSSRTTSYSCPAGTTALPSPSVSPWGPWVSTGATRNVFNTCAPATCSGNANESQWLGTSGTCPVGQSGTYTWEYEQTRSRTCNAGTWTAWRSGRARVLHEMWSIPAHHRRRAWHLRRNGASCHTRPRAQPA